MYLLRTLPSHWKVKVPALGLCLIHLGVLIANSEACAPTTAVTRTSREMTEEPANNAVADETVDPVYPGTAVSRLHNVQNRVKSLTPMQLSEDWEKVRRHILWAGGLRDLPNARPGKGYTGHSFNDFNHCDLTTMRGDEADNNNEGRVHGIAYNNRLGEGIRIASIEELGPGGSWSTCMIGCNKEPPQDVAHIQFKSRIAFKLVW